MRFMGTISTDDGLSFSERSEAAGNARGGWALASSENGSLRIAFQLKRVPCAQRTPLWARFRGRDVTDITAGGDGDHKKTRGRISWLIAAQRWIVD